MALCVFAALVALVALPQRLTWFTPVEGASLASLGPVAIEQAFPSLSFTKPVHATHAGDGTNRLWVVEQAGVVLVVPNDESATAVSVFLDIKSRVNDAGNEEGLLGLAFDPDYTENKYFYVHYSALSPRRSVISRFLASSSDPNQADPASELVLLEVSQLFANHNSGTLAFGPDGFLYISLGDGGDGGDPDGHGQNTGTLLGSMLRIDLSNSSSEEPYQVPAGNPFLGQGSAVREEIWTYGLRNPWKFSFDATTGDLWAGDVGQQAFEEIDIIEAVGNYGWNLMEGAHCYAPPAATCDQTGLNLPIFEYANPDEGCAIIGGHVYRGTRLPELKGSYIYSDFCSGSIWGLVYDGAAVIDQALLADTNLNISAIGADQNGGLYFLAFDGNIYRFVASEPAPVPGLTQWGLLVLAGALAIVMAWLRSVNRQMRSGL